MASLYRACDMFVSPYRGEGFSIPTLEAMASGLPVIVTRNGATDDFTSEQNAWYINSEPKLFEQNQNNANIMDKETYLLEPDYLELQETLEFVSKNPSNNFSMGLLGYRIAVKNWTWKHSTMKIINRLDFLYNTEMSRKAAPILAENEGDFALIADAELAFVNEDYNQAEQLFIYFLEHINLKNDEIIDSLNDNDLKNTLNQAQNYIYDKYIIHSFNRLAQIAIKNRKLIDAYKYSEAALTVMPDNPDAVWISAVILAAEEKYVEALEVLTPIVDNWRKLKYFSTVGIDLEKHLLFMGDTLFQMGDLEKASQIYEATLKANNFSAEACYGLGMCYKEAELFDDARNMFDWAVKYKPDYENALNELNSLQNN
jgi:tetratricopeptide (TPR) repeat protein